MHESLIILLLIILNGFFSMSEMAIVSARKPLLRQMAKSGNKRAERALELAEHSANFLSTVQVSITLIGILAGAYGGAALSGRLTEVIRPLPYLGDYAASIAVAAVVGAITFLSVVVGELVPKQIALARPETIATAVAGPMHALSLAGRPVVILLGLSVQALMRITGLGRNGAAEVTEAEVKAVLAEGAESGVIEKGEHDMITRIIRLGDREVRSVMTHRTDMTPLDVNDDLATIHEKIDRAGHARYPVVNKTHDHVIGYIEATDIFFAARDQSRAFWLADHVKAAVSISEHANSLKALELFKRSDVHMLVVVDEYGVTQGIVTAADLLEAIVGVMPSPDELPDGQARIRQREDGSWLVDGLLPIDEVHLALGLEEIRKDGGYETLAGFLLSAFGRPPAEGDMLERFGRRFEIIDMDGLRIDKVLIQTVTAVSEGIEKRD